MPIKTGPTVNSSNYDSEAITSYHAGLVAELQPTKGVCIQPELLYSTQGANYKDGFNEFRNELGYLSILLQKSILSNSVSLELGPSHPFFAERNNVDFNLRHSNFAAVGGLGLNITKNLLYKLDMVYLTEASKMPTLKIPPFKFQQEMFCRLETIYQKALYY
jgi:hypothetical protein